MKAKKIRKKKRATKITAAKGVSKKGTRKKKAATTPVGDIMRNAAEMIQSVAETIRP